MMTNITKNILRFQIVFLSLVLIESVSDLNLATLQLNQAAFNAQNQGNARRNQDSQYLVNLYNQQSQNSQGFVSSASQQFPVNHLVSSPIIQDANPFFGGNVQTLTVNNGPTSTFQASSIPTFPSINTGLISGAVSPSFLDPATNLLIPNSNLLLKDRDS